MTVVLGWWQGLEEKMTAGLWTCSSVPAQGGRCPQPFPFTYLSSRNPEADVFHSHDAFVREVVDLCEVLELHHVEVSFARLHPVPLCLDVPVLFSHGWQKRRFAMHSVKQEPTGRAERGPYLRASRQRCTCVLGVLRSLPGTSQGMQTYIGIRTVSVLSWYLHQLGN